MTTDVIDWLLEGDPSIRWQTERDLTDGPESQWRATRRLVAKEGWGAELLSHQDPSGTWGGGHYQPKWTSTTYTLLLLRRLGLEPGNEQAVAGCLRLLDDARWIDGGVSYWADHTFAERCINGMVLSVCSYFDVDDPRVASIAELMMSVPLGDGGWNCEDRRGATHSSFHTTISVLEGLTEWERRSGEAGVHHVIERGHEFLFDHRLYRSHTTGEVINEAWTKAWFPPRWHYDILRGLDHLCDAGARPDERTGDAIALLESQQRKDGRWPKGSQYTGKTFLTMEPGRVAGRWNTLRALRVLRWWSQATD